MTNLIEMPKRKYVWQIKDRELRNHIYAAYDTNRVLAKAQYLVDNPDTEAYIFSEDDKCMGLDPYTLIQGVDVSQNGLIILETGSYSERFVNPDFLVLVTKTEKTKMTNEIKNKKGEVIFTYEEDLNQADLSGADLTEADLRGTDLCRTDLSGADLTEADLRGTDLTEADLRGTDLCRTDLSGANLRGADLSGAYLYWADLSEADLSGANLRGADLSYADLCRDNLRGANLVGADLLGANLRGADLVGADLTGAHLFRADLSEADLYRIKLNKDQLETLAIAMGFKINKKGEIKC